MFILSLCLSAFLSAAESNAPPLFQVHSAFAGTTDKPGMKISWFSHTEPVSPTHESFVLYSSSDVSLGTAKNFGLSAVGAMPADSGCTYYKTGPHYRSTLENLMVSTKYYYRVVTMEMFNSTVKNSSEIMKAIMDLSSFNSTFALDDEALNLYFNMPTKLVTTEIMEFMVQRKPEESFSITVVADMGRVGHANTTHEWMTKNTGDDFILFPGDAGYADDCFTAKGKHFTFCYNEAFDDWMAWMQPFFSKMPLMLTPGNHDREDHSPYCYLFGGRACRLGLGNFTAYDCKFPMPHKESGSSANLWYSFDYGPAHFVSMNTETDFKGNPVDQYARILRIQGGHFAPAGEYVDWLEADLKKAHANREERPFIVGFGHRPFRIHDGKDCFSDSWPWDSPICNQFEEIVTQYVDLYVSGHIHYYSRLLPTETLRNTGIARLDVKPTNLEGEKKIYRSALISPGGAGNAEFDTRLLKKTIQGKTENFDYYSYGDSTSIGKLFFENKYTIRWKLFDSISGDLKDHFTIEADQKNPKNMPTFTVHTV